MKLRNFLALAALLGGASAYASVSFPECPAVDNDTSGCELLITVTAASGGVGTAFTVAASNPDLGPYDGSDDTLVGILNKSGLTLTSLSLTSSSDIFGFDGDGACSGAYGTIAGCAGFTDPSGYAPKGVTFSSVNSAQTAGIVNFSPGIANNGSSWFSLEEALTTSSITPGGTGTPEPSSMLLLGLGLSGISAVAVRRRRG